MKKKMISSLIAINSLLLPFAALPAWAQPSAQTTNTSEKEKLPEAVSATLTKLFAYEPQLKSLSEESRKLQKERGGQPISPVWVFLFNDQKSTPNDPLPKRAYIVIEASSGRLIAYDFNDIASSSTVSINPELAKQKAKAFLELILDAETIRTYEMHKAVHFSGSGWSDENGNEVRSVQAEVRFSRLVNGIPLLYDGPNSGIQIEVDEKGRITRFDSDLYIKLDTSKFPDLKKAVSLKEAEKAYLSALTPRLVYSEKEPTRRPVFGAPKGERPVLKYTIEPKPIDALTGKLVDEKQFGYVPSDDLFPRTVIPVQGQGKVLTASSAQEAAALLRQELKMDVQGLKMKESVNEYTGHKEYEWKKDENKVYTVSVTPGDNRVVRFGVYEHEQGSINAKKIEAVKAQRQTQALAALTPYIPQHVKQLEMMEIFPSSLKRPVPGWVDKSKLPDTDETLTDQTQSIMFTFRELQDGIPVQDRLYSITLDLADGSISNIRIPGASTPLPDHQKIISSEAAARSHLAKYPLRLYYIWPEYRGQQAPAPVLLYIPASIDAESYVDAISGEVKEIIRN